MKLERIREIIKNLRLSNKTRRYKSHKLSTSKIEIENHLNLSTQSTEYGEFHLIEPDDRTISKINQKHHKAIKTLTRMNLINNPSDNRVMFFDLETAGFWNTYIFLFGCVIIQDRKADFVQGFARDYSQEHSLLSYLRELITDSDLVITFNGKSFDVPVFQKRCDYFKIRRVDDINHLDLLQLARSKINKGTLPDRRLITLERTLLNKFRTGDIPSYIIPEVYHNYVKTQNAGDIIRVIKHNIYDVITLLELVPTLYKIKDPSQFI